jgi:hypothetical protein
MLLAFPKSKARKKTKVGEKYIPTLLQDAVDGYQNPTSLHKTKHFFSSF